MPVVLQPLQGARVTRVVALEVVDRDTEDGTELSALGEHRCRALDTNSDGSAQEFQAAVLLQRSRQQSRFGEDLKAVADAHDGTALAGEPADGCHDGAEAGDGAGAQVVAVGEPAG